MLKNISNFHIITLIIEADRDKTKQNEVITHRTQNVLGIIRYDWPDFPVLNRLSKITKTKFLF